MDYIYCFELGTEFILKKRGGVDKGKGYIHTKKLVKTNLYSIMRHPQYTAGIVFSLALVLVSQNLVVGLLTVVVIVFLIYRYSCSR